MTALQAKFAREAKDNPLDWMIGYGRGGYRLVYIGDTDNGKPDL